MQYFKHQSNMRHDLKIRRVIQKFGLEGYGLYNLILEAITESLTTNSPLPDLEENCEDMAMLYNGNTAKINEMMSFMVNQGLFELDEFTGRVLCGKVYKFLDTSQTRSDELRKMIKNYKESVKLLPETTCDASDTVSDSLIPSLTNMKELETETEEETEEKKPKRKRFSPPTIEEVSEYCQEKGVDPQRWHDHYTANGWMVGRNKMKDWKAAVRTWAGRDRSSQPTDQNSTQTTRRELSFSDMVFTGEFCQKHNREIVDGKCPMCEEEKIDR